MGKFYGKIGFVMNEETTPGNWMPVVKMRDDYYGDVEKIRSNLTPTDGLNDDLKIGNQRLSIIADPFAEQNFHTIRFVEWMDAFWKVTSVEIERPRLILSLGGVYNGPTE